MMWQIDAWFAHSMLSLCLSAGNAENTLSRCKDDNMSDGPFCNKCVFRWADPTWLIGRELIGCENGVEINLCRQNWASIHGACKSVTVKVYSAAGMIYFLSNALDRWLPHCSTATVHIIIGTQRSRRAEGTCVNILAASSQFSQPSSAPQHFILLCLWLSVSKVKLMLMTVIHSNLLWALVC